MVQLCHIRGYQAFAANVAGDSRFSRLAAEEGRDIADMQSANRFMSRFCRSWLGIALACRGRHRHGLVLCFTSLLEETMAANERMLTLIAYVGLCSAYAYVGDVGDRPPDAAESLDDLVAQYGRVS